MRARIHIDPEKITEFCRRNRIRKLSLFGSVLRDDFRPDSDVDFLVEFNPEVRIGYLGLAGLELELEELLGREVDLRTPQELSPYFRDEVVAGAELQYAEG